MRLFHVHHYNEFVRVNESVHEQKSVLNENRVPKILVYFKLYII